MGGVGENIERWDFKLGRLAYTAHQKIIRSKALPYFADLPMEEQVAWVETALTVKREVMARFESSDRW